MMTAYLCYSTDRKFFSNEDKGWLIVKKKIRFTTEGQEDILVGPGKYRVVEEPKEKDDAEVSIVVE